MPHTPDTVDLHTAAKLIGYGPIKLFRLLRDRRVLNSENIPYQKYIDQGLFKVECKYQWIEQFQQYRPYGQTHATNKGLEWLAKLIQEDQAA